MIMISSLIHYILWVRWLHWQISWLAVKTLVFFPKRRGWRKKKRPVKVSCISDWTDVNLSNYFLKVWNRFYKILYESHQDTAWFRFVVLSLEWTGKIYAGELCHCLSEWNLTNVSIGPTAMNTLLSQMYSHIIIHSAIDNGVYINFIKSKWSCNKWS